MTRITASSVSAAAITLVAGSMTVSADTNIFLVSSTPATVARWMYPFNSDPAGRTTASAFGSLGDQPIFDARDAQYLVGWNTTNVIPAGQGARNYAIRRARATLSVNSEQYVYAGGLRDFRTYFPTNDPRYLPPPRTNCPVELFGVGFRGGFTNEQEVFVPYAATNYPQAGPFLVNPANGFYSNRVAYAAGYDTSGALVDVSNNVGDDGTNEVANAWEVAPFAVGLNTNLVVGEIMPQRSQLVFDINLDDPLIYSYLQQSLNDGDLSFMATAFSVSSQGGGTIYPSFYTIFAAVTSNYFPLLDLEGAIIRPEVDTDGDGLPDDWEEFYFGTLSYRAADDPDSDGASNIREYQAGTDPSAAASVLCFTKIGQAQGGAEVQFNHAASRQYSVRYSDDLQNWQTVTNPALFYSSPWLSKSGAGLTYPSPVFAAWRDTNTTNRHRFYQIGTH